MGAKHDDRVTDLLLHQHGAIGGWQLEQLGYTRRAVEALVAGWRAPHSGVWVSGHAPLTPIQQWWAATLTSPDSVVSHETAAAAHGFWTGREMPPAVTRPGDGGRRCFGALRVFHSERLKQWDICLASGVPATTPERTLTDLLGQGRTSEFRERIWRRLVREALRTGAATPVTIEVACRRYTGRRGIARLRYITADYATLPAARSRSDAELLAVASIAGADLPAPELNVVRAGLEADLSWPDHRLIVELDGPSYHVLKRVDDDRDLIWARAGWRVVRVSTTVVYDDPGRFVRIVRAALLPTPPSSAGRTGFSPC